MVRSPGCDLTSLSPLIPRRNHLPMREGTLLLPLFCAWAAWVVFIESGSVCVGGGRPWPPHLQQESARLLRQPRLPSAGAGGVLPPRHPLRSPRRVCGDSLDSRPRSRRRCAGRLTAVACLVCEQRARERSCRVLDPRGADCAGRRSAVAAVATAPIIRPRRSCHRRACCDSRLSAEESPPLRWPSHGRRPPRARAARAREIVPRARSSWRRLSAEESPPLRWPSHGRRPPRARATHVRERSCLALDSRGVACAGRRLGDGCRRPRQS